MKIASFTGNTQPRAVLGTVALLALLAGAGVSRTPVFWDSK